ncbi:MAG: DNA primase [Dethiobacter sp.]|nr:DNA primase [Dethiobacter sp.]
MDGNITSELIEEIRSRTDIVALVSPYVHLKKVGRNFFGLCPFHAEKTPSFSVAQDKQIFHCFGCGASGNAYGFLMKMDSLTFPEAVRLLAERAGIRLPDVEFSPATAHRQQQKKRLLEATKLAANYYQEILVRSEYGKHARQYLEKRGLSPETINRFGLGFAPGSMESLRIFLGKKGFTVDELVTAGLLAESEKEFAYDRFRNRIIFPIHNQRGEVIAFGGRLLGDGVPKYLNSPETPLFDKGKNLYALHLARESIRKHAQAVVFEGYMDVIVAHQAGIVHCVASLGTSLTEMQARLLRSQAEEAIIVYDADTAGQNATWRGLQMLRQAGCLVRVGRLPAGSDPDDFIQRHGGEAFRQQVLGEALLVGDWQIQVLAQQYNLEKDDGRIRFMDKLTEALQSLPNALERESCLEKAATLLKVSVDTVREELQKKLPQRGRQSPLATDSAKAFSVRQLAPVAEERASLQILCLLSRFPHLIDHCTVEIQENYFPLELRAAFREAKAQKNFSPARLHDLLPEGRYRQLLGALMLQEEYEESIAKKALQDCVVHLKRVQLVGERKELAEKMARLDPVSSKGEFNELSRKWLELRKLEERLSLSKEGGKGLV